MDTSKARRAVLAGVVAVGGVGITTSVADAASPVKTVCANKKTGVLHIGGCGKVDKKVTLGTEGPRGLAGAPGAAGTPGAAGPQGPAGAIALIGNEGAANLTNAAWVPIASVSLGAGAWQFAAHVQSFNQSSTTGGGLLCVLQSAGNNPATDPFADSTGGFADASGAVDTSMVGLASLAAPGSYSVKCQEDVGAVTLQTFVNLTAVQGSTATGNDVGHARRSRPSGHAQLQALDRTNQVAAGR